MSTVYFHDRDLEREIVEAGQISRKVRARGGALMMVEVFFQTGACGAEHRHPHEQVTYCLSGVFEFTIAGETRLVRAGDSLYVPGGAEHGTRCLEGGHLLDVFTPQREDFLKNTTEDA